MSVFAQKGFEGASLSDLTEAMGINRPSMYAAFGSKGELFQKAVARYTQAREQHISQCLSAATAREGVDTLLRDGVKMLTSAGGFGGCFVTQGPLTGPDATEETRRDFVQKRATLERALKRRFDRAIEAGELSSDTASEDLARFYSVMVQGLALQAQHGGTKKQLLRVVDIAMARWPNEKRPRRSDTG